MTPAPGDRDRDDAHGRDHERARDRQRATAAERARRAGDVRLRRPTEDDYAWIVGVVDDWWDGRTLHVLLPRLWLQHFTGTSWLAEDETGRLAGFLIGFVSPDRPQVAYCHMIATDPNLRLHGLGRRLYERFFDDARTAGATEVHAVTWPGNRASVAFHRSMGFRPTDGPGTQVLYGTPAVAGYDYGLEDRVLFKRAL